GPAAFLFYPRREAAMYLLYLDESGTHQGSPVLSIAGMAVQEQDAWGLQRRLDSLLRSKLPQGLDPQDFELHAAEIKSPTGKKTPSNWAPIPLGVRLNVLRATFDVLRNHKAKDSRFPCSL